MNNNEWFYNSKDYITTQHALIEAKNIVSKNIGRLFKDKQASKIFREEIFPIIKFCEFIKAEKVLFCGQLI